MLLPLLASLALAGAPRGYVCVRADAAPHIDGRLNDPCWASAPWTEDFVDIEGDAKPRPRFRTRAKMLWDDRCLYIAAELEEPHVWATLTRHESVIFHDPDFEVFLDPDGDGQLYCEMEMNARNTTWDLLLARPYRAGGPPVDGFELKGMRTAVQVDGTINDPRDVDRGWTAEIAIPWTALMQIAGCPCPPRPGDQWRIDFSRVEWKVTVDGRRYRKVPGKPEDNWVWSPQGVVDMHRPERWGVMQFENRVTSPKPLPGFAERQTLDRVWEAEQAYRGVHGRFGSPEELGLQIDGLSIASTPSHFEATLGGWSLDDELRFRRK